MRSTEVSKRFLSYNRRRTAAHSIRSEVMAPRSRQTPDSTDAYGEEVWAHLRGEDAYEVLERDDGYVGLTGGPRVYFLPFENWMPHQQHAMQFVTGRALDIGAGAGRIALHLQQQDVPVTAIDNSPLAIRVCKRRGVRDVRVLAMSEIETMGRVYDTLILGGGNFGLVETPKKARRALAALHRISSPGACLIAESVDPYHKDTPALLTHRKGANKAKQFAGQLKLRLRFRNFCSDWFQYLLVSKKEMAAVVDGTGWRITEFLESGRHPYIAILKKV
jgi:SAM-dependent methyltransferase